MPLTHPFLILHPALCKDLDSNEVQTWAGHRRSHAFIREEGWETNFKINLDKRLGEKLYIPAGAYNVLECSGGDIRLGPIVGILSSYSHHPVLPSGKKARIYKELYDAARSKGLFIYRFYPEGVDKRRNLINGHTYNHHGRLYTGTFPMPDIVYNRIRYRDIEKRADVKKLLYYFRDKPGVYLFNSRFLNKFEVYRALIHDTGCAELVPETAILNVYSLKYFLGKYGEVYIKPISNSLGHGIVKVKKRSKDVYTVQFADSIHQRQKTSVGHVYRYLKQTGIQPSNYLVQKGIDLATLHGRVFDLRAQVQKDGFGEWTLTGVGVRVAGLNRIVTHIPNGGSAKAYGPVVDHVFQHMPRARSNIDAQLEFMAKQVPKVLNQRLPIELAILSMDIGLDKQGKLWLIEVNSKPSYFDEHHIRAVHTKTLIDYFIFSALNNLGGRE
ncbi:MAG TPA: YheC/YheD family protein [Syntrophomonadaceae bacterium]|nr:YheC/YheD family protein [Syntrophomonadaceae bacterium]